jgi:hypothetical protein
MRVGQLGVQIEDEDKNVVIISWIIGSKNVIVYSIAIAQNEGS